MKTGRSVSDLAKEVTRQNYAKKDYLVNTKVMRMDAPRTGRNPLMIFGEQVLGIRSLAHRQISQKLTIPAKYYDYMLENHTPLLGLNVNTWLHKFEETRLVRTLDGDMRAFLSKGYRPLDNYDLAETVLPLLNDNDYEIKSCEITENKFYLKAVTKRLYDEVEKDDIVQSGICISNSEVGLGRLSVEPLVYRLACLNGMIVNDYGIRKNHVGRRHIDSRDVSEFYRDETKQADDKAFWMKIQDVVRATFDEVKFRTIVGSLKEASSQHITGDPVKVVEKAKNHFLLSDTEQGSVLKHLVTGGSMTQYGLSNAIARMAQDVESYDRNTELQRYSGDVIVLKPTEWNILNAA